MATKPSKFHYAFIILLAVSLVRGLSGPVINASSGLFLTPVSTDLGVGIGELSLYLSISSVVTLIWLPMAGNLLEKVNVKLAALGSVLAQTLAFAALGFMKSVWGFYILSIPLAMGATLLVSLLGPIMINRWFRSNIGLIMGLMMTITSLIGAVFQPVLTGLIESRGWRLTYQIVGVAALVAMSVVVLLLLKNQPSDLGTTPFEGRGQEKKQAGSDTDPVALGVPASTALKTPAFYLLFLFMIVLTSFAVFAQHITTYGLGTGYALTSIGLALSFSMIGSAIGSVLIGLFSDRLGIIPTSVAIMAVGIGSVTLFLIGGSIYMVFVIATFLHGLATSSIGVVAPLLVTSYFGKQDYEKLFSYIMMGSPLASIILVPAYGFVYDRFRSYQPILLFLLIFLAIGAVSVYAGYLSSTKLHLQEKD